MMFLSTHLQGQPIDLETVALWVTIVSGVTTILKNLYETVDWSGTEAISAAISQGFWWVVELLCVGIAAAGVAAVWTVLWYASRVQAQSGFLQVSSEEAVLVFQLFSMVTITAAWLGFLVDEKELAAGILAFIFWFAVLIFSSPSGAIQHFKQLEGVAVTSIVFAAFTSPLAIVLGGELKAWLQT
jgi:hypothetical protein